MSWTEKAPSEYISDYLAFVEAARIDYWYCVEAMKKEENKTQDYLHKLELEDLTYHERSRVAAELIENRKARRNYKDAVEELEPIIKFFEEPQNSNVIKRLTHLLGQVRKVESKHQNRFYIPRELPMEPIRDKEDIAKVNSDKIESAS